MCLTILWGWRLKGLTSKYFNFEVSSRTNKVKDEYVNVHHLEFDLSTSELVFICLKSTIETLEKDMEYAQSFSIKTHQWCCSGVLIVKLATYFTLSSSVSIVDFEQINVSWVVILMSSLLTLDRFHSVFWCFYCWHWASKCCLGLQTCNKEFGSKVFRCT